MSFHTLSDEDGTFTTIYDGKELAKMVENSINWYKGHSELMSKRNEELYKNAQEIVKKDYEREITNLKEKLRLSYGSFASQKELDAYKIFTEKHMHQRKTSKAQGGEAPYLIPHYTGIGTSLEVVCPICGEKENITDMEMW